MGKLNESEILAIRQKADIVNIVSDYIPLTQKGKNYFAVCPFHDDHKPSMVVSKEKQIFNCFTCHTGGNVFTFIMKYENVSFIEAVKIVANKVGMDIHIASKNSYANDKNKALYEVLELSNKYYMNVLNTKNGIEAKEYLKKRGITEEIIKDFKIGLSTNEKDSLYQFLTGQNYKTDNIDEVGLINKSGINIYDTFSNRIMIPITNTNGQIVGYTGRIYHGENEAKYINSKETSVYKKSEILFNYYNAKPFIRESGNVIVVEGNMDAIKMYSSGVKNVIALMGTALSKFQMDMLKKLRVPVILMLDNDSAGLNATIKNGEALKKFGVETQVVRLKDFKDPDEYIEKYGIEEFKKVLKSPLKYIDFRLNYIKSNRNLNSSEDLANYIKEVISTIQSEDELTKKIIINKIATDNNIDVSLLTSQLNFEDNKDIKIPSKPSVVKEKKEDKYSILSKKILYYLMNDVQYILLFKNEIGYFESKKDRTMYNEIAYFYQNNKNGQLADLISYFEAIPELKEYASEIVSQEEELNYDTYIEYIKALKKYNAEVEIKNLKIRIKNEIDENEKIKLMDKLTKLKKGCVDYGRN